MGTVKTNGLREPAEAIDDIEDGFAAMEETRWFAGNPSRSTLWRWCREGLFPAPEWIGPNRRAWRRSALREWARDPEAWAARHRQHRIQAMQEVGHADEH